MDLYSWIVFLHVVGVLLFFIAHGTSMAVGFRLERERDPARVRALLELTDRKSLLALRGVGPESEAESVRFHGRRVTIVCPEVKHGLFRGEREISGGQIRGNTLRWAWVICRTCLNLLHHPSRSTSFASCFVA